MIQNQVFFCSKTHGPPFSLISFYSKDKSHLELLNLQTPLSGLCFLPSPPVPCTCTSACIYRDTRCLCPHALSMLCERMWVPYCQAGAKTAGVSWAAISPCVHVRRNPPHSSGFQPLGSSFKGKCAEVLLLAVFYQRCLLWLLFPLKNWMCLHEEYMVSFAG